MINGRCDERFALVRSELERNFSERGEVGASVCVTIDGEPVVDLWGGVADPATGRAWDRDTIAVVMSCTKGATALSAHLLAAAGELDFDAPVARYWPEFAANGKADITVYHLLSHQAGLPAVRDPLPPGALLDWDLMVGRLAAEEPFWAPGTQAGYHAFTFGFLVGEVIRRVSGSSLGAFFGKEVAEPLGLDFHIGLPAAAEDRTARLVPPPLPGPDTPLDRIYLLALTDPTSIQALTVFNTGGYMEPGAADTPAAHAAEIPAAGGITNARSLAGMYAPLATTGEIGSHRLDRGAIARMGACVSASSVDAVIEARTRWTLGFHKSVVSPPGVVPPYRCVLAETAFGHAGMGGSIGFADPAERMSFAFVMNKLNSSVALTNAQPVIDAVYRSLGYTSDRYGSWA